jgi:hypothetical protein
MGNKFLCTDTQLRKATSLQRSSAGQFQISLHMRTVALQALFCFLVTVPVLSNAQNQSAPFTGTWSIDLRTPSQKKERVECGIATFKLVQTGNKVVGDHSMATPQCGRLNEGGEGTVKGILVSGTAVLVVTSARNGQIVLGSATVRAGALHWQVSEEIRPGDPEGDPGLILHKGILQRESPR